MSFTLPDLVVEGAIRKGFNFLRLNAGMSPEPFVEVSNLVDLSGTPGVGTVFDGPLNVISGVTAFITGILRVPNVESITTNGLTLEWIDGNGETNIITSGASVETIAGTTTLADATMTFSGASLTGNIMLISFSLFTSNQPNLSNYRTSSAINSDTTTFVIAGRRGRFEIEGAGSEVLNMLFDFEAASDSKDGGIPSSVSGKYTQEPLRLREFFRKNEIAIIQSFSDVQTNLPCISIQLANDGEDQGLALTDDFGGIDGTFDSDVPAKDRLGRDESTIHANTTINVGIHTKEQLLTKYLYHITKYFILSAKEDLIRQNFIIATFKGSDFTRDASWQGDHVYTRFLNVSGKTEDSWVNLDEIVVALEDVGINIFVPQVGTPASIGPGANQTPAQDVGGNNFVNASPIFSSVSTAEALLQLPTSLYHTGNGMAVFVQRDGTGRQLFQSTPFNIVNNNKETSILTADGIDTTTDNTGSTTYVDGRGNTQPISYVADTSPANRIDQRILEIFEPATGVTSPVSTVQTPPPGGLVMSQVKQNIFDADGVIHRSDVDTSDL